MKNWTNSLMSVSKIVSILAVGACLSLVSCKKASDKQASSDKPVIKIGLDLPLSGNSSSPGETLRDAMHMALSKISSATKFKYEIIAEDNMMKTANAVTAAQKLVNVDKVHVIVSCYSHLTNAIKPITEKELVPMIGTSITDPNVGRDSKSTFVYFTHIDDQSDVFVKELQKRNVSKIGILYTNTEWGITVSDKLKEVLANTSPKVVFEERFNLGERDFRLAINKLKASGADYAVVEAFSPELELATKQLLDSGFKNVTSLSSFEFAPNEKALEGLWFASIVPSSQEFVTEFQQKYGRKPEYSGPTGYDMLNLIVTACEKISSDAPTRADILNALKSEKSYSGLAGTAVLGKDNFYSIPFVIKEMKNGTFVSVK